MKPGSRPWANNRWLSALTQVWHSRWRHSSSRAILSFYGPASGTFNSWCLVKMRSHQIGGRQRPTSCYIFKNSLTGDKQMHPIIVSPVFRTNGSLCSGATSLMACNCCTVEQKVKTILPQTCYVSAGRKKKNLPKKIIMLITSWSNQISPWTSCFISSSAAGLKTPLCLFYCEPCTQFQVSEGRQYDFSLIIPHKPYSAVTGTLSSLTHSSTSLPSEAFPPTSGSSQ